MKTILLATDGSPSARQATAFAIELAQATGWVLEVVTVRMPPTTVFGELLQESWQKLARSERENAKNLVDETVAEAQAKSVDASGSVAHGDPVTEICVAAEDAALVVVGAHGWGTVKRLVFGSVSSALLHEAPCPVLVVRGDIQVDLHDHVAAPARVDA